MNKEEAKQELHNLAFPKLDTIPEKLNISDVLRIVDEIDDPQKPKVPQVAVEFYERYKDDNLILGEWFGDFYSLQVRDEFPKVSELTKWLHDNDDETNRLREYALATLITFGPDSVEVIEEPLGVLLVDMPEKPLLKYSFLELSNDKFVIDDTDDIDILLSLAYRMTESEAKEKYPNFRWVSLEELENES